MQVSSRKAQSALGLPRLPDPTPPGSAESLLCALLLLLVCTGGCRVVCASRLEAAAGCGGICIQPRRRRPRQPPAAHPWQRVAEGEQERRLLVRPRDLSIKTLTRQAGGGLHISEERAAVRGHWPRALLPAGWCGGPVPPRGAAGGGRTHAVLRRLPRATRLLCMLGTSMPSAGQRRLLRAAVGWRLFASCAQRVWGVRE